MAIGYGSSDSPTRSIHDSMSTSNKKTTDHAKHDNVTKYHVLLAVALIRSH